MARKMLNAAWYFPMTTKLGDRDSSVEAEGATGIKATIEPDRRKRVRMQVHWPLLFSRPGTTEMVTTVTRDLSSDGFYCLADTTFLPGDTVECTLGVPTRHPRHGDRVLAVQCRVRVIRVEALQEFGRFGVGCRIEDYRFLAPADAVTESVPRSLPNYQKI